MKPCYILDLDGTLFDCTHRLHLIHERRPKDWDAFFDACVDDAPIPHIVTMAKHLQMACDLVFVSGRSDRVRKESEQALRDLGLFGPLYMRAAGDHKNDDLLKIEILALVRADGWAPILALDDRARVVAAWRKAGVPCAQVAAGDF